MHRIICYDVDEAKKKYTDLARTLPKITLDTKLNQYFIPKCRCALKFGKDIVKDMNQESREKYLLAKR